MSSISYCRVSTKNQSINGRSLDEQAKIISIYAINNNLNIIQYISEIMSGKKNRYLSNNINNGIKNIIKILGTKDFPRVRIGVDKKPDYMDLADFVLSKFSKEQMYDLYKILDEVSIAIDMILEGNMEKSMNKYNGETLL